MKPILMDHTDERCLRRILLRKLFTEVSKTLVTALSALWVGGFLGGNDNMPDLCAILGKIRNQGVGIDACIPDKAAFRQPIDEPINPILGP
ncbi:MAG: hypothetical protein WCS31_03775 [Verrucomicrobiae bacterium]